MRLGSPRARKVSKREATDKPSNQVTKTRNGGVGNPMTLLHATIVDPAAEYYDDYCAVFFLDPDGLKLEGMKYGEQLARAKRKPLKNKG